MINNNNNRDAVQIGLWVGIELRVDLHVTPHSNVYSVVIRHTCVFRSTPKSRPNNMGQASVRPSTKSFFDSDEIWYVGRGR